MHNVCIEAVLALFLIIFMKVISGLTMGQKGASVDEKYQHPTACFEILIIRTLRSSAVHMKVEKFSSG